MKHGRVNKVIEQKIWHEFQDNILKDSYDYIDQINQICKIVTDEGKSAWSVSNSITNC